MNFKRILLRPVIRYLAPVFYDSHFEVGKGRLYRGERSGLANTLFNLSSGDVYVGDRVVFGHGVMVVTGTHMFENGMRRSLNPGQDDGSWGGGPTEVPDRGRDVIIESGCFVGSGAIIIGPTHIGKNSIVAAGSVVKGYFAENSFIRGPLARESF